MVAHFEIIFRKNLPEIELVHQSLCAETGIDIIYNKAKWEMFNPFDEYDVFAIYKEGYNQVTITIGHPEITYLLGVTLRVLQQMGGLYKDEIPIWSIYTWEEYKKYWKTS